MVERNPQGIPNAGDQGNRKSWYALATPDDGPAEVMIYDDIGMFGVTAADFVRDIATIKADAVTVRINSYGGEVFEGIAILNAIRGLDATTTVVVDGIAASIASVIAMGGDHVVMNQNAQLMIHNAWNFASGNADELQRVADGLRSMSGNIATVYAAKAGGTAEEWQARMNDETWYTADEAVAAGLADEVIQGAKSDQLAFAHARAAASLRHFKYRGRETAPAPQIVPRAQAPLPSEAEVTKGKEAIMATLSESLVDKLGLDAGADEETILAAFEARIAEVPAGTAAPEPTTEQITAAAAKLGVCLVDKAQYESTTAAVAQMQVERAAQAKADDERLLDSAIAVGKLTPANKSNWLALMEHDRVGIRATLAQLPAGLIPVAEMGHGVGSEEDHLDAEMAHAYAKITGHELGKGN
ncbi:head maturation protease, ClpP-related [Mycobacterium sp. NPDC050853]|uniref:head maturation protease, ClpP-related n=1 Tax=Mycobacterium sp. NPDC050853 TaxID=3155160 RepID=UPI0033EDBAE6